MFSQLARHWMPSPLAGVSLGQRRRHWECHPATGTVTHLQSLPQWPLPPLLSSSSSPSPSLPPLPPLPPSLTASITTVIVTLTTCPDMLHHRRCVGRSQLSRACTPPSAGASTLTSRPTRLPHASYIGLNSCADLMPDPCLTFISPLVPCGIAGRHVTGEGE